MAVQYICGSSELPIEYNYVLSVLCCLDPIFPGGCIESAELADMIQAIEEFLVSGEISKEIIHFPKVSRDPFMEFWATFRSELEEEYPIGDDVEECILWLRKCEGCVINIVATV
jgi:hypothetical protein